MASRKPQLLNPAMFVILCLLSLSLFDCSVFVPSIPATMPKIIDILSHYGTTYDCEVCGAVLEGIDIMQHAALNSMKSGVSLIKPPNVGSGVQKCFDLQHATLKYPSGAKVEFSHEMHHYCHNILEWTLHLFETSNNKNDAIVSFVWKNHALLCFYIVQQMPKANRAFFKNKQNMCTPKQCIASLKGEEDSITFQFPEPSQVSRSSYTIPLYTYTWFLRYPLNAAHQERCHQFCEATLNLKERVQLFLWRLLVVCNVHHILYACRHIYPWLVRTLAVLTFLFSRAIGNYGPMNMYPPKSKDLDVSQPGLKDSVSRSDRNGISMRGSNSLNQVNGNQASGSNFAYHLDTYYQTRSSQTSKRKKR
ncbi:unnamed protein product [Phytomonas sp. EM1]|nr:unnamed protein product [Phytomonas sp. EM1]|eukprot:CCW63854.1 unnamed protein product [Phytomonas sp. isolate EM1]